MTGDPEGESSTTVEVVTGNGDAFRVPAELMTMSYEEFQDVFGPQTWTMMLQMLPQSARAELRSLLPANMALGKTRDVVAAEVLGGAEVGTFGRVPLRDFHTKLAGGYFDKDATLERERTRAAQRAENKQALKEIHASTLNRVVEQRRRHLDSHYPMPAAAAADAAADADGEQEYVASTVARGELLPGTDSTSAAAVARRLSIPVDAVGGLAEESVRSARERLSALLSDVHVAAMDAAFCEKAEPAATSPDAAAAAAATTARARIGQCLASSSDEDIVEGDGERASYFETALSEASRLRSKRSVSEMLGAHDDATGIADEAPETAASAIPQREAALDPRHRKRWLRRRRERQLEQQRRADRENNRTGGEAGVGDAEVARLLRAHVKRAATMGTAAEGPDAGAVDDASATVDGRHAASPAAIKSAATRMVLASRHEDARVQQIGTHDPGAVLGDSLRRVQASNRIVGDAGAKAGASASLLAAVAAETPENARERQAVLSPFPCFFALLQAILQRSKGWGAPVAHIERSVWRWQDSPTARQCHWVDRQRDWSVLVVSALRFMGGFAGEGVPALPEGCPQFVGFANGTGQQLICRWQPRASVDLRTLLLLDHLWHQAVCSA